MSLLLCVQSLTRNPLDHWLRDNFQRREFNQVSLPNSAVVTIDPEAALAADRA
jgi:hypothetical protein